MPTAVFTVQAISEERNALDLQTVLTGVSGVAGIAVDRGSGTVAVEYDPAFVSPALIKSAIEGAGYRPEEKT